QPLRLLSWAGRGPGLVPLSLDLFCALIYFALPEWLWGCTPGKYLLRLRVRTAEGEDRPGWARAVARTLAFYLLYDLGPVLATMGVVWTVRGPGEATTPGRVFASVLAVITLPVLAWALGVGLLALPMRRRNGYRGLHEWLSGTKVIRLPGAEPWRVPPVLVAAEAPSRPPGLPPRVGAFAVRGALRDTDGQRLLLGED